MASFSEVNSAAGRSNAALRATGRRWTAAASPDAAPVIWLAFDRRMALSDARWARQAAGIDASVVRHVRDAMVLCGLEAPLACIVEFELPEQDGVEALVQLRRAGVVAPAVLLTVCPELALAAVQRSELSEAVPVFGRAERFERLREWFDQLHTCCLLPGS